MNISTFISPCLACCVLSSSLCAQDGFTNNPEVLEFSGGSGVDPVYSSPTSLSTGEIYVYEDAPDVSGAVPSTPVRHTLYTASVFRKAAVAFEYFAQQDFRRSDGKFSFANVYFTLPMVDPRQHVYRGWHVDLSLNARASFFDVTGTDLIGEDALYTAGVIGSLFYNVDEKARLTLGVTPQFSSDLDHLSSSSFYLGAFAAFTYRANERIRITLGVSYMPDYYSEDFWPLVNVSWQLAPKWDLRIQSQRLGVVRKHGVRGNFEWGPFIQWNHFLWSVNRDRRTELMRMESFIIGLQTQYSKQTQRGTHMRFYLDLGLNFDQEIRFLGKDNKSTYDIYKADAGLYGRLGMEFSF